MKSLIIIERLKIYCILEYFQSIRRFNKNIKMKILSQVDNLDIYFKALIDEGKI